MTPENKRKEFKDHVYTTLIGGFLVILPLAILLIVLNWVFGLILGIIAPITNLMTFGGSIDKFLANILAIIIVLFICFGMGVLMRTSMGQYLWEQLDEHVLSKIPLYKGISETVKQFSNREKMPFSQVVLVDVFSNDTRMTGFITDEYNGDSLTVFVPTGPNPTNGFIFHVKEHQVQRIDVPVEDAMKSIIGVGTGSKKIMEKKMDDLESN
ncbi:MAG: DUF502 domain-containing protein [Bacteroidetes bacterium]|nr:DUF502 domain-containing protein [Bacteroidota bacterium]